MNSYIRDKFKDATIEECFITPWISKGNFSLKLISHRKTKTRVDIGSYQAEILYLTFIQLKRAALKTSPTLSMKDYD